MAAVIGGDKKVLIARSEDGRTWQNAGEVPVSVGPYGRGRRGDRRRDRSSPARDDDGQDADAVLAVRDTLGQEIPVDLSRVAGGGHARPYGDVASRRAEPRPSRSAARTATPPCGPRPTATGGPRGRDTGQALARPGKQRLLGVAPGGAGWLAVGTRPGTGRSSSPRRTARPGRRTPASALRARQGRPRGDVRGGGRRVRVRGRRRERLLRGHLVLPRPEDVEARRAAATWPARKAANRWMRGVVAGPSGYVAVGGLSDPAVKDAPRGRPAVWTSPTARRGR